LKIKHTYSSSIGENWFHVTFQASLGSPVRREVLEYAGDEETFFGKDAVQIITVNDQVIIAYDMSKIECSVQQIKWDTEAFITSIEWYLEEIYAEVR
jgi:hypothetical protein